MGKTRGTKRKESVTTTTVCVSGNDAVHKGSRKKLPVERRNRRLIGTEILAGVTRKEVETITQCTEELVAKISLSKETEIKADQLKADLDVQVRNLGKRIGVQKRVIQHLQKRTIALRTETTEKSEAAAHTAEQAIETIAKAHEPGVIARRNSLLQQEMQKARDDFALEESRAHVFRAE